MAEVLVFGCFQQQPLPGHSYEGNLEREANTMMRDWIFTYKWHSSNVNAVAWSPDGKRIASGSGDRMAQV